MPDQAEPAAEPTGPTSPSPRAPRVHFPAMDGYRAVAALLVLVAHVALLSGLNGRNHALGPYLARTDVGVSVFFLISGFLLYRPFVAARLEGLPSGSLGGYARRRLLRILPAYWFALTIVAFVLHAPGFGDGHSVPMHYFLVHIYDFGQVTGGPVQQSWSLATEISFYVFLPFWAWAVGARRRTPVRQIRVEVASLVVLWVAVVALKLGVAASGVADDRFGQFGTWLPFRLDEFALGMGMAVASAWVAHRRIALPRWVTRPPATLASWAIAAGLFWVVSTRLDLPPFPRYTPHQAMSVWALYGFTALFLLLPGVFADRDRGPVKALLQHRAIVWLGLISYGIYIWHEAWLDLYVRWTDAKVFQAAFWPMLGATLALTIASAAVSWYLVERPALRFKGGAPMLSRREHTAPGDEPTPVP